MAVINDLALLLLLSFSCCHSFYHGSRKVATYPFGRVNSFSAIRPYTRIDRKIRTSSVRLETDEVPAQSYHYELTVLLPAYNEIDRIGCTLCKYISHLSQSQVYRPIGARISSGTVSILAIDDGSTDGTADFVRGRTYLQSLPEQQEGCWDVNINVKCISLKQNEGKGAAIAKGMQEIESSGLNNNLDVWEETRQIVLVADADGSGDMSCLNNMIHELEMLLQTSEANKSNATKDALVAGYRVCKEKSALRSILSWGFRTAVSLIFLGSELGVRDSQCGFKLMTLSSGKTLYNKLNLQRWTHDVEVIHRAQLMDIPVGECAVTWVDAEGSKLVTSASTAVIASFVMLKEICFMRLMYLSGEWGIGKLEQ
ncbi:hypothetical protein ACHAXN_003665 [Cyclotella atomus]